MSSAMPGCWSDWLTDIASGRRYRIWRENGNILLYQWDGENGSCTDENGRPVIGNPPEWPRIQYHADSRFQDSSSLLSSSRHQKRSFVDSRYTTPSARRDRMHFSAPLSSMSFEDLSGARLSEPEELAVASKNKNMPAIPRLFLDAEATAATEAPAEDLEYFDDKKSNLDIDSRKLMSESIVAEDFLRTTSEHQAELWPSLTEPARYKTKTSRERDSHERLIERAPMRKQRISSDSYSNLNKSVNASTIRPCQLSAESTERRRDGFPAGYETPSHDSDTKSSPADQLPRTRQTVATPSLPAVPPEQPSNTSRASSEIHFHRHLPTGSQELRYPANESRNALEKQQAPTPSYYAPRSERSSDRCYVPPDRPSPMKELEKAKATDRDVKELEKVNERSEERHKLLSSLMSRMKPSFWNKSFGVSGASVATRAPFAAPMNLSKDVTLDHSKYSNSIWSDSNRDSKSLTSDSVSPSENSDEIKYSGLVSEFVNELSKVIVSTCLKSITRSKESNQPHGHRAQDCFSSLSSLEHTPKSHVKRRRRRQACSEATSLLGFSGGEPCALQNEDSVLLSEEGFHASLSGRGSGGEEKSENKGQMRKGQSQSALDDRSRAEDGKKRKRLSDRNSSSPPDSDDDGVDRSSTGKKQPRTAKKLRLFACPYYKHDPVRYSAQNTEENAYRGCAVKKLANISRLKQHLYRVHKKPEHYCARCYEVFQSQREKDTHARQNHCSIVEEKFGEKMDQDKLNAIKRRKQGADPVQSWFSIYSILFPNKEPPLSPYNHFGDSDAIEHFIGIFRTLGPDLARDLYSNLARTHDGAQPLAISTQDIVDEAFEIALPQYLEIIEQRKHSSEHQTSSMLNSENTGVMQSAADKSIVANMNGVESPSSSHTEVQDFGGQQIETPNSNDVLWQPSNGFGPGLLSCPTRNDDLLNPIFPWFDDAFGQYNPTLLDYYPVFGTEIGTEMEEVRGY